MRKTHDGEGNMMALTGKQKQFGKYAEQGGAARSNNFSSQSGPGFTPVKKASKKSAAIPNPMDILAAPQRKKM